MQRSKEKRISAPLPPPPKRTSSRGVAFREPPPPQQASAGPNAPRAKGRGKGKRKIVLAPTTESDEETTHSASLIKRNRLQNLVTEQEAESCHPVTTPATIAEEIETPATVDPPTVQEEAIQVPSSPSAQAEEARPASPAQANTQGNLLNSSSAIASPVEPPAVTVSTIPAPISNITAPISTAPAYSPAPSNPSIPLQQDNALHNLLSAALTTFRPAMQTLPGPTSSFTLPESNQNTRQTSDHPDPLRRIQISLDETRLLLAQILEVLKMILQRQ